MCSWAQAPSGRIAAWYEGAVTPIAFAFLSALVWGTADYCGGRASVRGGALSVTVLSQLVGLPVLALCVILVPGRPHLGDLGWAAAAGAAGFFGIVLLYRSLSTGAMAVAAPTTAVTGAVVPMGIGLLLRESPAALGLVGACCAVVAIGLVSLGSPTRGGRVSASVIGLALGSGAMFGFFFALLAQTDPESGMWPLVAVRAVSISLGLVIMWRRGVPVRLPRAITAWVLVAGAGDISANALYLVAARAGLLSLVAPIAALYPVSTVLLALTLDRERVRAIQLLGLGLAATALVLTAV